MEIISYGGSYITYEYPEVWVFCDVCQKSHPVGECEEPAVTISTGGDWMIYKIRPHCGQQIKEKS